MKKINFLAVLAAMIFVMQACDNNSTVRPEVNENSSTVKPAVSNTDVLGVILPNTTASGVNRLIMLEDGRKINPVSGIEGFSKKNYGTKLRVSFAEVKSNTDILDVAITSFAEAAEATFSKNEQIALSGKYSGILYYMTSDSSVTYTGKPILLLTESNYSCSLSGDALGGAGLFARHIDNKRIHFVSTTSLPNGANEDLALSGYFNFMASEKYIFIWAKRNGVSIAYNFTKE